MTRADALAATAGRERGSLPQELVIRTDTRALVPGECFLALRGPNFDGHAFVGEAVRRGAAAVVVDDDAAVPEHLPALVVAETHAAYLALAGAARVRSRARYVAVTGSAGKTTTKDLLAQLLARAGDGPVRATLANENNEIGVAKLLLVPDEAAYVVAELGARHFGEIEPLARLVRPEVAVLTNIGEAHLEIMGSPERLAETKWGIFATGATPVLGLADATSRTRGRSLPNARWFGAREADGAGAETPDLVSDWQTSVIGREAVALRSPSGEERLALDVRLPGDHNRRNLAAAFAAALALGLDPRRLAAAVRDLRLPAGRYERLAAGALAIVYDAYNASASGAAATLASFAREPAARRIAVLGSMAELGDDAPALHESTGAAAARAHLDVLLALGPHARDLVRGARRAGFAADRIVTPDDNEAAVRWLREHGREGDLVLLKASRRYRFEEIADALGAVRG